MKKILCISLVLLLILGGISAAFAAESLKTADPADPGKTGAVAAADAPGTTAAAVNETSAAVDPANTSGTTENGAAAADTTVTPASPSDTTVSGTTFTGEPVKLSLEDAYKKMLADSAGAKMAELNKQNADGVARGYSETVKNINDASNAISAGLNSSDPAAQAAAAAGMWALDTSNKNMLKADREYATAQGPRNYDAEIKNLKRTTLNNYYTLKELENQVTIAKDSLALKEKLLTNTQLKFKLGTVSKNDVLQAETAVYQAKDSLIAAQNGLDTMKMGFNQFMGYNLLQNVNLTDEIKEIPLSTKSLNDSIKDALVNRNEIFSAAFNLQMANFQLSNFKAYPKSSSKYIKANMAVLMAETANKNAPLSVESDVRTKYMAMTAKYSAVQTGKKAVENAKETERLVGLQYDAGMATLSDVQAAQLNSYSQQLAYSKTLLEYNLAVSDYELASTVGTSTNPIQ